MAPVIWEPARFTHARFDGLRDLVTRLATPDWPAIGELDALLPELRTAGMRLIDSPKTRATVAADGTIDPASLYEVMIVMRGEIPTRPRNLHDLLNALVWAAFPHTKLALTRRLATIQRARAAGRATLPSSRSREHDRLAMFDEGAVVHAGERSWIFGHAIYEHAYAGDLDVRGAAVDVDVVASSPSLVDARAAIDNALSQLDLAAAMRDGLGVALD